MSGGGGGGGGGFRLSPTEEAAERRKQKAAVRKALRRKRLSLADVYGCPTITDNTIISEQLRRIELLLERIATKLEEPTDE